MYDNIPLELKQLKQWCACEEDKIPLTPTTGKRASPVNPNTWGTFIEAVAAGRHGIGLVLTPNDPYCVIDLDNSDDYRIIKRQNKIIEVFDSYTEISQSGLGHHVVIKASLPSGARRDKVEIYSQDRFIIFTGKITTRPAKPIKDQQQFALRLYNEMGGEKVAKLLEQGEAEDPLTDHTLVDLAMNASNGEKFTRLCQGLWMDEYPSQSEADLALISMLAFYTRSNEQVRRIFRMTALGQRDKATRNNVYIDHTVRRVRATQAADVEVTEIIEQPVVHAPKPPLPLPIGLAGEVTQFILKNATRPVFEVALVGALALLAGIAGRSYSISGTGLNQYFILLAPTGTGKEGAAQGIDKLIQALSQKIPAVVDYLGPGAFASGQALLRILEEKPCFVSVLGEFGLTLQQISNSKANSAEIMLRKVLLDLYNKSGPDNYLRPSVYSNAEKNTQMVRAPNVTILGESTPSTFYDGLSEDLVTQGLIPRFTLVEYQGGRPPRNPNANIEPPEALIQGLVRFTTVALNLQVQNKHQEVQIDVDARRLLDAFDVECDRLINDSKSEAISQIWNRAHLKALKLSALLAVGFNPIDPMVNMPIAEWAILAIRQDCDRMEGRFRTGLVGRGANGGATESQLENDILRILQNGLTRSADSSKDYKIPTKLEGTAYINYDYLRRRTRALRSFQIDPRGHAKALKETLQEMVKAEVLIKVDPMRAITEFNTTQELYGFGINGRVIIMD